jgi:uncharacterized protein YhhL (DUF1145 family)
MNINEIDNYEQDLTTSENQPLLKNEDKTENEIDEIGDEPTTKKPSRLTKIQLMILFILIFDAFMGAAYYLLLAPFFPAEAIKKGISQTQVGIIFGVFEFIILILSPVFGKYVSTRTV